MRPGWDEYFIKMVKIIAERSTCTRRKVGALITVNKHIVASGYNGVPKGIRHCAEAGCLREKYNVPSGEKHELCRGLHAEQNAIIQAAVLSTSIKGGTLYCTNFPCIVCAKMLINSDIKRIVILHDYPDKLSKEILKEAGVEVEIFDEVNF